MLRGTDVKAVKSMSLFYVAKDDTNLSDSQGVKYTLSAPDHLLISVFLATMTSKITSERCMYMYVSKPNFISFNFEARFGSSATKTCSHSILGADGIDKVFI